MWPRRWYRGQVAFFRSGEPGGEGLLIGLKCGDLIEGVLFGFFRSGQLGGERLLIGIKRFDFIESRLLCFFH